MHVDSFDPQIRSKTKMKMKTILGATARRRKKQRHHLQKSYRKC
jgi:hypothetical protein